MVVVRPLVVCCSVAHAYALPQRTLASSTCVWYFHRLLPVVFVGRRGTPGLSEARFETVEDDDFDDSVDSPRLGGGGRGFPRDTTMRGRLGKHGPRRAHSRHTDAKKRYSSIREESVGDADLSTLGATGGGAGQGGGSAGGTRGRLRDGRHRRPQSTSLLGPGSNALESSPELRQQLRASRRVGTALVGGADDDDGPGLLFSNGRHDRDRDRDGGRGFDDNLTRPVHRSLLESALQTNGLDSPSGADSSSYDMLGLRENSLIAGSSIDLDLSLIHI